MKFIKNNKILIIIIAVIIVIIGIYIINNRKHKITYDNLDITTTWNEEIAIKINLENNKNVNIEKGGTYVIEGKSTNTNILIDTTDDVILVLNNAEIINETGPAITIENSNKTVITINENTTNKLSNGNTENEDYDAVIFSKDDLTINGEGNLEITSNYENGIKCTDNLKIMSGNIKINAKTNGIIGKDSITIKSGNIDIISGKDGIKSNNTEDEKLGNIIIEDANIIINSKEDGIQSENDLMINNGTFDITTNNGSKELTAKQGWEKTNNESSESAKALKASNITLNSGTFKINSNDDGIHSNGNLTINDGKYEIKSSDDALHADKLLEINKGSFNITSAEGLEATYVKINDGNITIEASDDGMNAGKKSNEYTPTIEINGGNITIKMGNGDTDAVDSNGNLYINGGTIDITGQSPFDYDGEAKYKGGKIIVNGKETTEITNQFMGGMQGKQNMQGEMPNKEQGNMNQPRQNMKR